MGKWVGRAGPNSGAECHGAVFTAQSASKNKLREMLPENVAVPAKMTGPQLAAVVKVWRAPTLD